MNLFILFHFIFISNYVLEIYFVHLETAAFVVLNSQQNWLTCIYAIASGIQISLVLARKNSTTWINLPLQNSLELQKFRVRTGFQREYT